MLEQNNVCFFSNFKCMTCSHLVQFFFSRHSSNLSARKRHSYSSYLWWYNLVVRVLVWNINFLSSYGGTYIVSHMYGSYFWLLMFHTFLKIHQTNAWWKLSSQEKVTILIPKSYFMCTTYAQLICDIHSCYKG